MKLFSTIDDDKCVLVIRTLDWAIIQPVVACDDLLLKELIEKQGENKLIANLDDLVRLDVLSLKYSDKGTPNYRLTKLGYTIIEGLGKIGAGLKEGNI